MRPIPPEIWAIAVSIGILQRDKSHNPEVAKAGLMLFQQIEQFLKASRKEKRK